MKYGLTFREKAIWPPKKQIDGLAFMEGCFWFMLGCVLVAVLLGASIKPSGHQPIVKTYQQLSDKEQEKQYCAMVAKGTPVHGGTATALELHCMKYS